jgi:hypothetical protein
MEQLENGLVTAIEVNRLMQEEVERLVLELDRVEKERDAWKHHSAQLVKQLQMARKESFGVVDADVQMKLIEQMSPASLPDLQPGRGPGSALGAVSSLDNAEGAPITLTDPMTQHVLARGRAAGWLVSKSEVCAALHQQDEFLNCFWFAGQLRMLALNHMVFLTSFFALGREKGHSRWLVLRLAFCFTDHPGLPFGPGHVRHHLQG